ncbi:cytochrome c-552 [Variibacter gotjawalensis]|uniref:Cytochrome c-552 n=1 Tax=Variibacter gotjawalensis TaxID=1333996 RepID=A0A0S3PQL6_9BRAD|nr:cytochrome c family protein [Variibacter gotjawalensis]NIK48473.1 cytochrome c [Variibacter gotjawalensis]RZS50340.1 cytochrome c [Variibacter gotjawalensis]BAT58173.1 cytochrome c-552 [Variibacter gotjawalensis]
MDSYELNKVFGAILFTCLCVLSLNIAAGAIYTPKKVEKPGYEIVVPEAPAAGGPAAPAEPEVPIAQLLAKADVAKGENAAKVCQTCHTFNKGEPNKVGPNLYGVVGEKKGEGRGFNFSAAMKGKGGEWTFEDLDKFLQNPRGFVPGTNMSYAGMARGGQRADLIAFLNSKSDHPQAIPQAAEKK